MAAIALTTANKVEVIKSLDQKTLKAGEAIVAGAPVYTSSTGVWLNADAATAAHFVGVHIATHTAALGEALTAIRKGNMDGWVLAGMAYNDSVFVSDTAGTLANASGSTSLVVARVAASTATPLGTAPDKTLTIDCPL